MGKHEQSRGPIRRAHQARIDQNYCEKNGEDGVVDLVLAAEDCIISRFAYGTRLKPLASEHKIVESLPVGERLNAH